MKLEVTKTQLKAIISMRDDMYSMLGTADDDSHWVRYIMLVDNMLKKNNKEGY